MRRDQPIPAIAAAAVLMSLTLVGCAASVQTAPASESPTISENPVVRLPIAGEVFGPAEWSAQARKGSAPLVLGDFVVIATATGVYALNADGKEEWQTTIELLPDASRPDGVRDVVSVTQEVVAVIDKGTLPKGSDPLASEASGTRITLLNVKDGSAIAEQTLPGDQVNQTIGLAFKINGNGSDRVAFTPTGEKVTNQDGKLPLATVGEHIVWGMPYTANMGVEAIRVTGLPMENANLGASDGREIVALNSYDGTTTTTMWVNLATGDSLTPDDSCTQPLMPKTLVASPGGAYAIGDNAIADIEEGTVTCTGGGAGQRTVLWRAVTDEGVAYGQTAEANDTFVIRRGSEIETYPIPADATRTVLIGFTNEGTAILFDSDTGIINANPIL